MAAGTLVYLASVLWTTTQLPVDGVPLHFDASGTVDRFGTRDDAISAYSVLGGLVTLIAIGSLCLARWGPLTLVNTPHKEYWTTQERRSRFRRMMTDDLGLVMGILLAYLSTIPFATAWALRSDPPALPPHLLWIPLAALVIATIVWCVWLSRVRYDPARQE